MPITIEWQNDKLTTTKQQQKKTIYPNRKVQQVITYSCALRMHVKVYIFVSFLKIYTIFFFSRFVPCLSISFNVKQFEDLFWWDTSMELRRKPKLGREYKKKINKAHAHAIKIWNDFLFFVFSFFFVFKLDKKIQCNSDTNKSNL